MYSYSEDFLTIFLILFLIGVIIVTIRARSRRKEKTPPQGKQIAIIGQQLTTYLSKQTPLPCLLADGHKYGDGYQDKTIPELPHCTGCQCRLTEVFQRSRELFSEPKTDAHRSTDLGKIPATEARYYRYRLITRHPNATDEQRADFNELARMVAVSAEFAKRVERHLKDAPPND
jgi:hypothetical protein